MPGKNKQVFQAYHHYSNCVGRGTLLLPVLVRRVYTLSLVLFALAGTTTNRRMIISFKKGAFLPKLPVQPFLIKYNNRLVILVGVSDLISRGGGGGL